MKLKLAAVAVLGLTSVVAFADGSPIYDNAKNQNNAYASKLSKLKSEVASLQQKVNSTSGNGTAASGSSAAYVNFNHAVSSTLNSGDHPYGKMAYALSKVHGVTLGGQVKTVGSYERIKFNGTKDSSSMFLANADVSVAAQVVHGLVGYAKIGINNYFNTTSTSTSSLELRDAFLAYQLGGGMHIGVGKTDVAFGDMSRVNAYANPVTRAFMLHGNNVQFGIQEANGLDATVSVLNGGTSAVPTTAAPTTANQINNFALNVNYAIPVNGVKASVGAGYENASQFNLANIGWGDSTTSYSGVQTGQRNAAYDLNAQVAVDNLNISAEYVSTVDRINQDSNSSSKKAAAWSLGAAYKLSQLMGANPATVAVSYGEYRPGANSSAAGQVTAKGDSWNKQLSLSVDQQVMKGINVGLEYDYTQAAMVSDPSSKDSTVNAVVGASF